MERVSSFSAEVLWGAEVLWRAEVLWGAELTSLSCFLQPERHIISISIIVVNRCILLNYAVFLFFTTPGMGNFFLSAPSLLILPYHYYNIFISIRLLNLMLFHIRVAIGHHLIILC